jgi:hypothetical protein
MKNLRTLLCAAIGGWILAIGTTLPAWAQDEGEWGLDDEDRHEEIHDDEHEPPKKFKSKEKPPTFDEMTRQKVINPDLVVHNVSCFDGTVHVEYDMPYDGTLEVKILDSENVVRFINHYAVPSGEGRSFHFKPKIPAGGYTIRFGYKGKKYETKFFMIY